MAARSNVLQISCRKIAVKQICQTNTWTKTDHLGKLLTYNLQNGYFYNTI